VTGPEDVAADRTLAALLRACPPVVGVDTPCVDANLLCGFAEGSLLADERVAVEAHLARCALCREVVAAVALSAPSSPRSKRRRSAWLGLAAAVLVAGGTAWVVLSRSRAEEASTDLRLVAVARDLAADLPDLFGDFTPLPHDERLASGNTLERGGLVPLQPSRRILTARPTFRFEPEPGASGYEITVRAADGTLAWRTATATTEVPFPADQGDLQRGGRYFWQLRAAGASAGETPAARTFEVVDEPTRDRTEAALRAIDARCPRRLAALMRAHFALRGGFLAEAEAAARSALATLGDDAVARETMFAVATALGASEAERFRPR